MFIKVLIIYLISTNVYSQTSSPFELTEDYFKEFQKGIDDLRKLSEKYEFHEDTYQPSDYNETEAWRNALDYDFIIIGGGASGAVIANRLSEVPEWKILLLEAGGPETEYTQIPNLFRSLQNTPKTWGFTTTVQKTWCQGMVDNKCPIYAAKSLGGSTATGPMTYVRGNPIDYDIWAYQGNDGWCYKDVLPYFKKMEDVDLDSFDYNSHYQGGPIHIEKIQYTTPLAETVLNAGKELLGIESIDYNGEQQIGFSITQFMTKYGKRFSTAQAYLETISQRKNLIIQPYSRVTNIVISKNIKKATAVKYVRDGKLFVAKTKKEIILSAGVINTPQLLLLSGIGPKEDLRKLKIDPIQDLQVGKNFRDNIAFIGLDFIYNETRYDPHTEKENLFNYVTNGKGLLTTNNIEVFAFLQSKLAKEHYPDIQLVFINVNRKREDERKLFRFTQETYNSHWEPLEDKTGFAIHILLTHPKSIGTVTLKDNNPFHYPIIDSNQLSDPDDYDIKTMIAGIREAIRITKTECIRKLGININYNRVHGCTYFEFDSDDYWKCALRHLSVSLSLYSGTAKMGPKTDRKAVVDNEMKVYGIEQLRVADASIIPVSTSGNTPTIEIMIGEKVSDLIKTDWR